MPSLSTTFRTVQHRLRSWAGGHPALFERLVQLRGAKAHLLVNPDTDLVIEGFPRSGNTFAVAALLSSQRQRTIIARHLHVPSQIMRAAQWGVPAMVLVRNPGDAVMSLTIREPHISLRRGLLDYLRFHRGIEALGDHYVVGTFEEVVGSFGTVVQRLNDRFGTDFAPYTHTPEAEQKVFAEIERMDREDTGRGQTSEATVSRPSEGRNRRKEALRRTLETSHRDLLDAAEGLFEAFAARATSTRIEEIR